MNANRRKQSRKVKSRDPREKVAQPARLDTTEMPAPPEPDATEAREQTGIHLWQQHAGPSGCRSWDTVALSTRRSFADDDENIQVTTRYRRCLACGENYKYVVVMQRAHKYDPWSESGSGFGA